MKRKIFSVIVNLLFFFANSFRKFLLYSCGQDVKFGKGLKVFGSVSIKATDGGSVVIGSNVSISRNVKIVVQSGSLRIGNNVHIGDNSIIVSRKSICIGNDTLIAEFNVIRDQDHVINNGLFRSSDFKCESIVIGNNVWLGAKTTVLKGSVVEDNCVLGAHSLVNSFIPKNSLAVGVPARAHKRL